MKIPLIRTGLSRNTAFSFSCGRCLKCCQGKKIQVNPYEVARIASRLGISTTECIERYTVDNGSFLKFDENNTCIFLDANGCGIHSDRPLVCRLYPLARHTNDRYEEWFSELQQEIECRGVSGNDTAIEEYLEEQGVPSYIQAADSYLKILWEMITLCEEMPEFEETPEQPENSERDEKDLFMTGSWTDMDATVKYYCREIQSPFPLEIEKKMLMHLDALHFLLKPT